MTRSRTWGYEQPDCTGNNALGLFIDDLDYVIQHFVRAPGLQTEARVFQAQAAANTLVQEYRDRARKTQAFNGQYIEIRAVNMGNDTVQLLPVFSPGLKQALTTLLEKTRTTQPH